jgi:hypothetical protein
MVERKRSKAATTTCRRGRPRRRDDGPDMATVLAAFARAWTTTVIASAFFLAALATARVWDGAVFRRALQDVLPVDTQYEQPIQNKQ